MGSSSNGLKRGSHVNQRLGEATLGGGTYAKSAQENRPCEGLALGREISEAEHSSEGLRQRPSQRSVLDDWLGKGLRRG